MLEIKKGGEYTAKRVRRGTSERGDWELVVVEQGFGKNHQTITLFPRNCPTELEEGGTFRVTDIMSMKVKRKKLPTGNWTPDEMSAEVTIEVAFGSGSSDLSAADFGMDDLLSPGGDDDLL